MSVQNPTFSTKKTLGIQFPSPLYPISKNPQNSYPPLNNFLPNPNISNNLSAPKKFGIRPYLKKYS
jgi:hypothetical protein